MAGRRDDALHQRQQRCPGQERGLSPSEHQERTRGLPVEQVSLRHEGARRGGRDPRELHLKGGFVGSASAMSSINRVLEKHGKRLHKEAANGLKKGMVLVYQETALENNLYSVSVVHEFRLKNGKKIFLNGNPLDIDALAERYPDCRVGY